jgi:hypothetical protein
MLSLALAGEVRQGHVLEVFRLSSGARTLGAAGELHLRRGVRCLGGRGSQHPRERAQIMSAHPGSCRRLSVLATRSRFNGSARMAP